MAHWITVPILCNNDHTHSLKELGLEYGPDDCDVRQGKLNTDFLFCYYPIPNGHTLVETTGSTI